MRGGGFYASSVFELTVDGREGFLFVGNSDLPTRSYF